MDKLEETKIYELSKIKEIPSVINNFTFFATEKWKIANEEQNPIDFLFLNRSCFNGMIRFNRSLKFNVPYGHKPERFAQAYITKIINQIEYLEMVFSLNNWEFKCQSFEKTLASKRSQF